MLNVKTVFLVLSGNLKPVDIEAFEEIGTGHVKELPEPTYGLEDGSTKSQ